MQVKNPTKKTVWRHFKDFIFAPLRFLLLPDEISEKLGLTSLEQERLNAVLPYIKGRLLDIGAGRNRLVQLYGNGVGVDVRDWGGGALVVDDASKLSFADRSFDTVTFVASLNHIPNRVAVLNEAYRLLKDDSKLIITMIGPILGKLGHFLWWYGEDRKRRGMKKGEVSGMKKTEIDRLLTAAGFKMVGHQRFDYGLNNLYCARKTKSRDGNGQSKTI